MAFLSVAIFIMRVAAFLGFMALLFRLRSRTKSRLGVLVVVLCVATFGIIVLRQLLELWSDGLVALQTPLVEDSLAPLQRAVVACLAVVAAIYFWRLFDAYESDVESMRQGQVNLADELDESLRHFRRLVENMPFACCTFDRAGTILSWNRAAQTIYGYSTEEAVGKRLFDLIGRPLGEPAANDAVDRVFRNEYLDRVTWKDRDVQGRTGYRTGNAFLVGRGETTASYGVAMISDISEQKRLEKARDKESQLLRELYDLQERERKTIAGELHDGMLQYLVGAKLQLDAFRNGHSKMLTNDAGTLDAMDSHLKSALAEGRRMVSDLRPLIIDEQGILAAIEHLINDAYRDSPFEIVFHHRGSFDGLDPMIQNTVFRIVQESLTNLLRHSAASRAHVAVARTNDKIDLTVEDDGCGFDVAAVPTDRRGVRGIQERARLFGGSAQFDTAPGQGTRIHVNLPVAAIASGALNQQVPPEGVAST